MNRCLYLGTVGYANSYNHCSLKRRCSKRKRSNPCRWSIRMWTGWGRASSRVPPRVPAPRPWSTTWTTPARAGRPSTRRWCGSPSLIVPGDWWPASAGSPPSYLVAQPPHPARSLAALWPVAHPSIPRARGTDTGSEPGEAGPVWTVARSSALGGDSARTSEGTGCLAPHIRATQRPGLPAAKMVYLFSRELGNLTFYVKPNFHSSATHSALCYRSHSAAVCLSAPEWGFAPHTMDRWVKCQFYEMKIPPFPKCAWQKTLGSNSASLRRWCWNTTAALYVTEMIRKGFWDGRARLVVEGIVFGVFPAPKIFLGGQISRQHWSFFRVWFIL